MFWEILQFAAAGLVAFLGVASLRAAFDVFRNFPDEMGRRRDPMNYEDRLVGMQVEKDGSIRFKTKRKLKRKILAVFALSVGGLVNR